VYRGLRVVLHVYHITLRVYSLDRVLHQPTLVHRALPLDIVEVPGEGQVNPVPEQQRVDLTLQ
jgi:hypothetical protein